MTQANLATSAASDTTRTASSEQPVGTSQYLAMRGLTEELAKPLGPEDQTVQSMPDASPTKWHRAHTTWFFETFILNNHCPAYKMLDPAYTYLFNSYYEAVGARHPRPGRGLLTRPGIEEVARYRSHVDQAMLDLLDGGPLAGEVAALAELGTNHEQQHQELLLMDIKHLLSCNPLHPAYRSLSGPGATGAAPPPSWVGHPGGPVEVGHAGSGFAFDNESPRHLVQLTPFVVASQPVTNGEWLCFIEDGGYQRPELWLSDGWATVQAQGWEAPQYWSRDPDCGAGGGWQAFTLGGQRRVHPSEAVCHVSYYEADAFARWAGARLPTEAEWETIAAGRPDSGGFLDLDVCHPRPVSPAQHSLIGDVWQWTASSYAPYPGFQAAPGAVGEYNGKFMVSQYVLRGASCLTPPGHARVTYRNFFPPWARWCVSGVRLAQDA
ncbi:MAG: ergothioneine biosynthesis protein EgtB [Acidimicrobiales bacterium]